MSKQSYTGLLAMFLSGTPCFFLNHILTLRNMMRRSIEMRGPMPARTSFCPTKGWPLLLLLGAAGCANYDFVPGPGVAAYQLTSHAAQCRLMARGTASGYAVGAYGSPRFVAGYMAGAAIAGAVGNAIQVNANYNDCMMARGWLPVRAGTAVAQAPAPVPDVAQPAPAAAITQASFSPSLGEPASAVAPAPRLASARPLGVRAVPMSDTDAMSLGFRDRYGLLVQLVSDGSVGDASGLQAGDVLLTLGQAQLRSLESLEDKLREIGPDEMVVARVWRNGRERPITLRF